MLNYSYFLVLLSYLYGRTLVNPNLIMRKTIKKNILKHVKQENVNVNFTLLIIVMFLSFTFHNHFNLACFTNPINGGDMRCDHCTAEVEITNGKIKSVICMKIMCLWDMK